MHNHIFFNQSFFKNIFRIILLTIIEISKLKKVFFVFSSEFKNDGYFFLRRRNLCDTVFLKLSYFILPCLICRQVWSLNVTIEDSKKTVSQIFRLRKIKISVILEFWRKDEKVLIQFRNFDNCRQNYPKNVLEKRLVKKNMIMHLL